MNKCFSFKIFASHSLGFLEVHLQTTKPLAILGFFHAKIEQVAINDKQDHIRNGDMMTRQQHRFYFEVITARPKYSICINKVTKIR